MDPTCQYLITADGRQTPCGEPATHSRRTRGGGVFYYCNQHADHAFRNMKRQGKTLALSECKPH